MDNTFEQLQPDNQQFRNIVFGALLVVAMFFLVVLKYL
jgi:hypothetical protein